MSKKKTYGYSSAGVGAALAVLFGILSAVGSGSNQGAYIAAAVTCAVAGLAGLLIGIFSD